ncbi:uncharacterized protein LOC131664012 [Phymastichus coffea]|uniref:uncharacterized protein LOC131664012 n=1 Tax=Phymastichus coffea TaxID=108790 RepID=UPI00273AE6E9|nr:uncharacterized protein LOC131664012 [Phymastichus coffea]
MVIYREDVIKLNRVLSHQFEKDLELAENRPFLLAHYPSFHRYFKLHYYYTGSIIFLMIISPILALRHGQYVRAYPQLIPFAYEPGGWIHWSIYGFELVEGLYCWTNTVGIDSLFGLYALHMVGQLKLLAHRFRNLKAGANYKKQLKDCVDMHARLIESKYLMEKVFGFLSVWLAVTCAIVICAIIFQSSQTRSMTIFKLIYLIVYCTIKFIQAYTYAWFGYIINFESKVCIDSIYYAYWAGQGDLQLMNDVLIVLSQNSMDFKALGVMIVRMDMFSKIMNTSVSYFFLLKTLDAKLETS